MSIFMQLDENARWRRQQLLEEAEKDRMLAQLPPRPLPGRPRLPRAMRVRLAQALYALASWLSPELPQPGPAFKLARASRRNGMR